jgi:L-fuconolactonase
MPPKTRCSRRRFVVSGLRAAAALATTAPQILAAAPKAEEEPAAGFPRIDTHTHFYDPSRPEGVPWPPADDALLYRRVLPKDYHALPVPSPLTGTIVVEASPWVEDNQWVLDLAARDPVIVGLVGNLPVGTAAFAGHLRRFAANPVFRGIRLRDRKLEASLDDPAFVSDLRRVADHDLALDLVGGREILAFANRLARTLPGLRIVIDHLAGVAVDGKAPPVDWLAGLRPLEDRPNVYFKVSGLVEGTGRTDGSAPREITFYRPVLDAMRERFGVERLMFGSNWPVSERFAPLGTVQAIVADYFRGHGRAAEEAVFWRSARMAYRWANRDPRVR